MKNKNYNSPQKESLSEQRYAIPKENIRWILLGLLIMVLGYVLMMGGGSKDPNVFSGEEMFSFRRIVLAPILIFMGFIFEIWAIMYKKSVK